MDPDIQAWIEKNFVPVWIDDKKDERFAGSVLKLTDKGYPNLALLEADGTYYGRVIGFGGKEPWFAQMKASLERGGKIRDLRKKAAADPAANAELAPLLAEVPDMEQAALDAFAAVPEGKRTAEVTLAEASLRGRLAWDKVKESINEDFNSLMAGVDRNDREAFIKARLEAMKAFAPKAKEKIDAFLKDFPTAEEAADALFTKVSVLFQSEAFQEVVDAGKAFLEKFPEHLAVQSVQKWFEESTENLPK